MITIDGPLWFLGAIVICGAHVLYLRSWRRDHEQSLAWWRTYDARAQKRHDAFMQAIGRADVDTLGWNLDGGNVRGQA